ncbi:MAG: hypothetical protein JNL42_02945 [Anaerolineae bacterium]|nr:hypothetical protein [Anaerolineae bacterium]
MTTHDSREEGRYEQVILAVFFRLADDSIGIVEFSDREEPDDLSIHAVRRYRLIRQHV